MKEVRDERPPSLEPRIQCDLIYEVTYRFMMEIYARVDNARKILGARLLLVVHDYEMGGDEFEIRTPQFSQALKSIYCADTFRPYRELFSWDICWV